MRVHYLQHVAFEGLGSIEPWLRTRGHALTGSHLFVEGTRLPEADAVDLLIVMGGPMSVNDEREHPWLVGEKELVRRCVTSGKAVLGVCLGAQLIASAMGARVHRHHTKEIGWFPVHAVPGVAGFRFPSSAEVFHWHGETFDLPAGAVHLARSQACENQAFQLGRRVMGLQFHLETTPDSARAIVTHCAAELVPSRWVQPGATILAAAPERYASINALMGEVLSHLCDGARG